MNSTNKGGRPSTGIIKTIRVPKDQWETFGLTTTAAGTGRQHAIRAFIAWYNRTPGAELPERPDTTTR